MKTSTSSSPSLTFHVCIPSKFGRTRGWLVLQASGGVGCLATSSHQVAAGLTSGHAAVLDARSGTVAACWKAHDACVTRLAIIGSHRILSSSQVL